MFAKVCPISVRPTAQQSEAVMHVTAERDVGAKPPLGEGTIDQILDDLAQLRLLGAGTVVLDPFNGDPEETHHPEAAWYALAAISARARHLEEQP